MKNNEIFSACLEGYRKLNNETPEERDAREERIKKEYRKKHPHYVNVEGSRWLRMTNTQYDFFKEETNKLKKKESSFSSIGEIAEVALWRK